MEKREIAELFKQIDIYYPNRNQAEPEQAKQKFEAWALVLQKYPRERVFKNFYDHVETSSFPPLIADLVKKEKIVDEPKSTIRNAEETQDYLKQFETDAGCTAEEVEEQLANLRRILNIEDGEDQ